jgi:hypothetical protein
MTFSGQAFAYEVQCQTQWDDLLLVVKVSPSSLKTYLLFMNENEIEKYWHLPASNIKVSSSSFLFKDEDTEINIDLLKNQGRVYSLAPIIRDTRSIKLKGCETFL